MPDLTDPKLQKAIRHVEKLLTEAGPGTPNPQGIPAREVINAGEAVGLTRWQLRTARDVLKVTSEKETDVKHGRWFWRLPSDHVPIQLPTTSPAGSHSGSYKLTSTTESVSQPPPSMSNRTQGTMGSDDAVRAWFQRKGFPISKFGPVPQWAVEAFERDAAKPASSMREVSYQSHCPQCDRPSVVLTRMVEFLEPQTVNSMGSTTREPGQCFARSADRHGWQTRRPESKSRLLSWNLKAAAARLPIQSVGKY
jgi:hypothetical protein